MRCKDTIKNDNIREICDKNDVLRCFLDDAICECHVSLYASHESDGRCDAYCSGIVLGFLEAMEAAILRIYKKNITLTYVKRHRYCNFYTEARKSRFLLQTGNTDNQYVTAMVFCQESREGRSGLQRGRCCIAKPALLHCRTAVTGMSGGPYGEITMSKTCVNEAGKAFLPFWFEKNKMRFFQNNTPVRDKKTNIHR